MSYTQSVLQPGEQLLMAGKLHWIVYLPAVQLALTGVVAAIVEAGFLTGPERAPIIAMTLVAFSLLSILATLRAWFIRWITEFSVTDRRVIYKRGFISRHTAEMNMDKVESVAVSQSILGRILDYGTIHVIGTGQGIEHLHRIARPLALRSAIIAR